VSTSGTSTNGTGTSGVSGAGGPPPPPPAGGCIHPPVPQGTLYLWHALSASRPAACPPPWGGPVARRRRARALRSAPAGAPGQGGRPRADPLQPREGRRSAGR
jgi:hypothetical protein